MRTFCDTVIALFLLIVMSPLLLATTLLIVICSPGNPFYRASTRGKRRPCVPDVEIPHYGPERGYEWSARNGPR